LTLIIAYRHGCRGVYKRGYGVLVKCGKDLFSILLFFCVFYNLSGKGEGGPNPKRYHFTRHWFITMFCVYTR